MTKKQFIVITEVIMSFFPKFEQKISTPTRQKIWFEMFEDLDFQNTQVALKKVLVDSKFMPTVSEIRQAVADIENPDNSITGSEAWGQIRGAISKHGIYNEKSALDSMDDRVAQIAKRFGWKDICMSENISVVRSNFIKLWEIQQTKDKKFTALPSSVKQQLTHNTELRKKLNQIAESKRLN